MDDDEDDDVVDTAEELICEKCGDVIFDLSLCELCGSYGLAFV